LDPLADIPASHMRHAFWIALVALIAAPIPLPAQETYNECGMAGSSVGAKGRALNRLKNRYAAPGPADMDTAVTLTALLEPGDDRTRWKEQRGATVVGYVRDAKPGGIETSNCLAADRRFRDTHIELVLDPMNAAALPVIVEVTGRWRAMMAARGIDWSSRTLRRQIVGRWVRVTGWLMFDSEHAGAADNTAPGRHRNWRATAWEIHPITAMEVVPGPR
jgi:hypothetical protein